MFWPTLLPADASRSGSRSVTESWDRTSPTAARRRTWSRTRSCPMPVPPGPTTRAPLGNVLGARSGDKAGNATLGVWARDDATHAWLRSWWGEEQLRGPDPRGAAGCELRLWELPLLRACGVTIVGLLGRGVAANPHLDAQGKGLGEYVRAKHLDIPDGAAAMKKVDATVVTGGLDARRRRRRRPPRCGRATTRPGCPRSTTTRC